MTADQAGRPAVFLDRDGTLIEERHYLGDPDQVVLLPGVVDGLRKFAAAGYLLIIVTNQSGVGRGLLTLEQVHKVNDRVDQLLAAAGVSIDAWYACPHAPDAQCDCRKPLPGMVDQACRELEIDVSRSLVIGDKDADLGLAAARGMPGFLVLTGHGANHKDWAQERGFEIAADLGAVAVLHFNMQALRM